MSGFVRVCVCAWVWAGGCVPTLYVVLVWLLVLLSLFAAHRRSGVLASRVLEKKAGLLSSVVRA